MLVVLMLAVAVLKMGRVVAVWAVGKVGDVVMFSPTVEVVEVMKRTKMLRLAGA